MAKHKYKFNRRTLEYERHRVKWSTRLLWSFAWLSTAVLFGVAFHAVMISVFRTSKEIQLKREITKLQDEYDNQERLEGAVHCLSARANGRVADPTPVCR